MGAALLLVAACGSKTDEPVAPAASAPAEQSAQAPAAESESDAVAVNDDEAVSLSAAPSNQAVWNVDRSKSRIEFTGTQTGKEFSGAFSKFDVSVAFDPANLEGSYIKATIETASAKTGDRQRDDALPSGDWFSAGAFPAAVFESSDIRSAGGGYEARGTLTVRGVTKDLTLPFSVAITGDRAVADGEAALVRTDFGVGQGEFATGEWVGLDVKVKIHVEASR